MAERIREAGCVPILHVRQGNDPALTLYERIGFRLHQERFVYVFAPPGWKPPKGMEGTLA
ncbi:MAG: hypothetical protein CL931_17155 [Deltaproteobacteria bacterium]|nr:hypothetical protein [Deltaproteobacteria bacterium]